MWPSDNFNYNENAQDKEIIDKLLTGDVIETGSAGSTCGEDKPSFATREEYNNILKDMGFNRTGIWL